MILLSFFVLSKAAPPWHLFTTEKDLLQSCNFCLKFLKAFKNTTKKIQVEANSECANPETENRFCKLVDGLNTTFARYETLPSNLCGIVGPCVPQDSQFFNGTHCYACRYMTALLSFIPESDRRQAVVSLCASSRSVFTDLCGLLDKKRLDTFVSAFNRINSSSRYCVASKMCRVIATPTPKPAHPATEYRNADL